MSNDSDFTIGADGGGSAEGPSAGAVADLLDAYCEHEIYEGLPITEDVSAVARRVDHAGPKAQAIVLAKWLKDLEDYPTAQNYALIGMVLLAMRDASPTPSPSQQGKTQG